MIEHKLDCGATLVAQRLPNFRSVTIGIWTGAGSIMETPELNGISHFIEHMLFKGTKKRTAKQIAIEVDNIGGQMNAFTSKEATCYYIKVMDEKMREGIDVLTDLFCNATIPSDELERERGVVLEEIAMSNDMPDDVVMDLIAETFYKGTSLARPILGPPSNIEGFTRQDLIDYMNRFYRADNIVIAAAGSFDEHELIDLLNEKMDGIPEQPVDIPEFAHVGGFPYKPGFAVTQKDIEQVHICFGIPCCSMQNMEKRQALHTLNNILGGSMSSRLFQKIREEMGMAYSVYSAPDLHRDTGMLSVYAATTAKNARIVTEMILEELHRIRKEGITHDEFLQSREMTKGSLVLQMESTSARMSTLGRNKILTGSAWTEEEYLDFAEAVTEEQVREQIAQITAPDSISAAYVGCCDKPEELEATLAQREKRA